MPSFCASAIRIRMRRESGSSSPGCRQVSSEDDGTSCSPVEIWKLGDTRLAAPSHIFPLPVGSIASPGHKLCHSACPRRRALSPRPPTVTRPGSADPHPAPRRSNASARASRVRAGGAGLSHHGRNLSFPRPPVSETVSRSVCGRTCTMCQEDWDRTTTKCVF